MEVCEVLTIKELSASSAEELYKQAFPRVAAFVSKMGGSFDDAKDILHDAFVVYFEALQKYDFTLKTNEEAYILGIAKHLWIRKYNRDNRYVSLTNAENEISVPNDFYPDKNDKKLLCFLEVAGKKCMDLLRAFYYKGLSIKNLTIAQGYPNEHATSAQKYKCLEKIRETIKQKSLTYEDFAA